VSLKELLPTYWSLEPGIAQLVKDCYSPMSLFDKVERSTIFFELGYWQGYKYIKRDIPTLDHLMVAIPAIEEDTCSITVWEKANSEIIGEGTYEIVESPDELLAWTEESDQARGLADCINERWRMQTKEDD
jgi:hypothetical protein